jgi:hypothetical protein
MPYKDPEKRRENQRARSRAFRERQKVERFGPEAAGVDMRGRHGNHARGEKHPRWNDGRLLSSDGYVLVRVGKDHPMAFGQGYAYEHDLVAVAALGRPLAPDEMVHHKHGNKTDNRWGESLVVVTRSEHARIHDAERGRDELGRFPPRSGRAA